MDTFIKALKELYPVSKMSRFQNDSPFWTQCIDEVKYDLQVVPGKLGDLRKKYSAQIIAMDQLHPMADVKRTLSDYLFAFIASGNAHRRKAHNVTFYSDFRDAAYQEEATVDRFIYLFEKTATQWERDEFKVAERCKKRSHASSSNSGPDRSSNTDRNPTKRVESTSEPSGQSIPQTTTVTAHCDGCGKLNHKREDCKSNETHPDFNKTGCCSYEKIAEQLAASGMSHLHPILRNNFRARSTTMIG